MSQPAVTPTWTRDVDNFSLPHGGLGLVNTAITIYSFVLLSAARSPILPGRRLRHPRFAGLLCGAWAITSLVVNMVSLAKLSMMRGFTELELIVGGDVIFQLCWGTVLCWFLLDVQVQYKLYDIAQKGRQRDQQPADANVLLETGQQHVDMAPRPIGTPIADEMTRAGRISPTTTDRNEQQRADASAASETVPGTVPEEEIPIAGVPDRPRSIIDQVHETAATTTAARRTGMFSLPMLTTPWTRRESEPGPSYIPKLSMARFTSKVESRAVLAWPILITIITLQLAGTILVAISLRSGEVGTATKIIVGAGACLVVLCGVIPVHMKPKRAQHVGTLMDAFLRLSLVRIWLFSTLFCLAAGVRVYTDWILGRAFDDVGGVGLHGGKGVLMWCYFCLSKCLLLAF